MPSEGFYTVLPSNSCPSIHPDNSANKYTVTWENAIDLSQGGWEVALTEANFNYPNQGVNAGFGFHYRYYKVLSYEFKAQILVHGDIVKILPPNNFSSDSKHLLFDDWKMLKVARIGKKFVFSTKNHFSIKFEDQKAPIKLGLSTTEQSRLDSADREWSTGLFTIDGIADSELIEQTRGKDPYLINVEVLYKSRKQILDVIEYFDSDVQWDVNASGEEVAKYINDKFGVIFSYFKYSKTTNRFEFMMNRGVVDLYFLNGLHFLLGFKRLFYSVEEDFIPEAQIANFAPQLNASINNMYIYASICAPIRVGDTLVPLLKSLWLDANKRNYNVGEMMSIVVKHPMYLPVSGTTINSVEINIRSDSGHLIPFLPGAVTSLTLHFKRNHG